MNRLVFAFLTILAAVTLSHAKTITLKDGTVIQGKIINTNNTSITVEDERGNATILKLDSILEPEKLFVREQTKPVAPESGDTPQKKRIDALGIDLGSTLQFVIQGGFGTAFTYEFSLNPSSAIEIRCAAGSGHVSVPTSFGTFLYDAFLIMPGFSWKWYPGNESVRNFWLGLGLNAGFAFASGRSGISVIPAIYIGNKFVFGAEGGFFIEPLLGAGASISSGVSPLLDFGLRIGFTM